MIPGYHTAGLLLHDVRDSIDRLAEMGFGCVALRPHPGSFHPAHPEFDAQLRRISEGITRSGIRTVIDLDALYVHDAWSERGPTLMSTREVDRRRARDWIERWVGIAEELGSSAVTFSSGATDPAGPADDETVLETLALELNRLSERTRASAVALAIRPRCRDAIASVAQFERLGHWLAQPERLRLAADVGEMVTGAEFPVGDRLARHLDRLACVYLSNHRAGVPGDQRVGHGDVALVRIVAGLEAARFAGPVIARVEGHSEWGLVPAREALSLLEEARQVGRKAVKRPGGA